MSSPMSGSGDVTRAQTDTEISFHTFNVKERMIKKAYGLTEWEFLIHFAFKECHKLLRSLSLLLLWLPFSFLLFKKVNFVFANNATSSRGTSKKAHLIFNELYVEKK
jgi:hypothetical protein